MYCVSTIDSIQSPNGQSDAKPNLQLAPAKQGHIEAGGRGAHGEGVSLRKYHFCSWGYSWRAIHGGAAGAEEECATAGLGEARQPGRPSELRVAHSGGWNGIFAGGICKMLNRR